MSERVNGSPSRELQTCIRMDLRAAGDVLVVVEVVKGSETYKLDGLGFSKDGAPMKLVACTDRTGRTVARGGSVGSPERI